VPGAIQPVQQVIGIAYAELKRAWSAPRAGVPLDEIVHPEWKISTASSQLLRFWLATDARPSAAQAPRLPPGFANAF
jgi:hypothetical protein